MASNGSARDAAAGGYADKVVGTDPEVQWHGRQQSAMRLPGKCVTPTLRNGRLRMKLANDGSKLPGPYSDAKQRLLAK
jgi:hypothetical protein